MKNSFFYSCVLILTAFVSFAQQRPQSQKVTVSGKVVDKISSFPLEYAAILFHKPGSQEVITGGVTDNNGEFNIEVNAGVYDIKVEFISFEVIEIKQKELRQNTNLGVIALAEEGIMLEGVEIRAERSSVEIKLDKRVYNVGQDMMVKGGTVSDVLDNVPSVSVDVEGNVSLRGNDNVRILIDGRPSGIAGVNVAEALRMIPADAIDKVEVITNPSARYDAEGGGGILNIILKKGKNQGLNGTFTATTGYPDNHGITGNINLRSEKFNLFTTQGYNYRKTPGNSLTDAEYLNPDGTTRNYIYERRKNEREREGYNANFGMEWFLDESITWTNTFSYRRNNGSNPDNVTFDNYDADRVFQFQRTRFNNQKNKSENLEFSTNLMKKFKKDGHQLSLDAAVSRNNDTDDALIFDSTFGDDRTFSIQKQNRHQAQVDYVLPLGENSRFEAGYRGDFQDVVTDFTAENFDTDSEEWIDNPNFTNIFEYKEYVNAFYSQYGSKVNKFSYMFGLRWEDSNIQVNQLITDDFNTKRYNNLFPSAFFGYEFSESTNITLSYSRRIQRPRGRFLNPFPNLSSNINIFQGNPDLDPAMTHSIDLGYIKRWGKLTLSTSAYFNLTEDSFQFVRRESGDFVETEVDGTIVSTPIILSSPINLATQYRFGFEFTLNYNPYRWWRLNGNFNFFRNETQGDYVYTDFQGNEIIQNFDNVALSWFARINSKITLPGKIDWQTNATYNAPQRNAQGKSLGVLSANLALSKDVLKDKGTIVFNISDVFNSRKRINEVNLPALNSYSEMQWRERQFNLSFTYRFNKQKNERERERQRRDDGDDDFMG